MQNDFVKTVDFRVCLVLIAFRYYFYHRLTIFALINPKVTRKRFYSESCQFLVLASIPYKRDQCHTTLGGLSSVCAKLEPASSKDNEMFEINVLQKFTPHIVRALSILPTFILAGKITRCLKMFRKTIISHYLALIKAMQFV